VTRALIIAGTGHHLRARRRGTTTACHRLVVTHRGGTHGCRAWHAGHGPDRTRTKLRHSFLGYSKLLTRENALQFRKSRVDVFGMITSHSLTEAETDGRDSGFTLIELMVVLLILAILLAIAIPTFLGVTKSANDRGAQSNLNTALTDATALYESQGQSYFSSTVNTSALFATALGNSEPNLTFSTTNSASQSTISVAVSTDGNAIVLASYSKGSHNCWYIIDNPTPPVATSDPPWTGTVTASPSTTAGSLVVPSTQGTIYAEAKGDATATDCSASAPKLSGTGAVWQYASGGFPS
jgi:type IV pilus assembly protein PilA